MKRISLLLTIILCISALFTLHSCNEEEVNSTHFLQAVGKELRNDYGKGEEVILRGINLGGWLVQEPWMNPTIFTDQLSMMETLIDRFGNDTAYGLMDVYEDNYIQENDLDNIKSFGFNVIRLPFTYLNLLDSDMNMREDAFKRIDWIIDECARREIYVILDMHGAVGSQNGKEHSGDTRGASLYTSEENMSKTEELWVAIADRYKDEEWVAGYDLLNEPEGGQEHTDSMQWDYYDRLYNSIREVDINHLIIMEAVWEPYHLPRPSKYGWENVMYEYHFYCWDNINDFETQKAFYDTKTAYSNAINYGVPELIGEFNAFDVHDSWEYMLNMYNDNNWSWTMWTYKTEQQGSWGLYNGNTPKVDIINDSEEEIRTKWGEIATTNGYEPNTWLIEILSNYA